MRNLTWLACLWLATTPCAAATATKPADQAAATAMIYAMVAEARAAPAGGFDPAFRAVFRKTMARTDDRTSALVIRALTVDPKALDPASQAGQVLPLVFPLVPALIAEDDARRYLIARDVQVRTPDGATVCALVVRPRSVAGRAPTLMQFTIYNDPGNLMAEARRTASHGYVGVEGLTRGKGCSPGQPIPYEHDGADAAALIDWIAAQPWSDGRVGMFGGSYEGFTQWAAARHHPRALKALMPSVSAAPGIDVPMEGNQFYSFVYYWPLYAASSKTLDNAPYDDHARWDRMERTWYQTGAAYRDLPRIDGTPNPIFEHWLDHPDYDRFWSGMIPQGEDFASIDIPVLTTTGFYDDAQIGALHYLLETEAHHSRSEHYLLIGPYDHIRGQRGTYGRLGGALTTLRGYHTDPVAQVDLGELRYQWFDYVFRGGPRPALLQDRINYQVMGADRWKHVATLAAIGPDRLRLHLTQAQSGGLRLSAAPVDGRASTLKVDLADRSDIDRPAVGGGIVDKALDTANGLAFVSDPFPAPVEVSGLFSAGLDLVANKKDFDFSLGLYELTAAGDYVELSHYIGRASHVGDPRHRHLLSPGVRTRLELTSGRLTSRQFQAGSRLVALFAVVKQPQLQINYGSGKDVSDETIADAGEPLVIRLFGDSTLDVPTAH
jgi:hypothetical protein